MPSRVHSPSYDNLGPLEGDLRLGISVGVIGTGAMGLSHVLTLRKHVANAEVVAVYDADLERSSIAANHSGASQFDSGADLIAAKEVDAVLIASPDETHFEFVKACIDLGKPVLCEKPLAETASESFRLAEMEKNAGRSLVQVGFMRRFDPDYVDLKAAYEAGVVGDAKLVRCIHRNAISPAYVLGGMAITNAMIHEFDILRWLLNTEVRRIRVSGVTTAGLIDPSLATVEMESGHLVDIEVSMSVAYGYDIRTEIIGSKGVLDLGRKLPTVHRGASGESRQHPVDFVERFSDAYRIQLLDWVERLSGGHPMTQAALAWDGYVAMEIAEAGLKSVADDDWVEVNVKQFA